MEIVHPIKDKRKINAMKRQLNDRDRLLFVIGINSALRISDILRLRVADVRDKDGTISEYIFVREEKTKKSKRSLVNGAIKRELTAYLTSDKSDDAYLFPSRKGINKPISRFQALRILKQTAERVGIKENVGTHTLRKTFAYHRFKSGVDITYITKALNHSSQRETMRYIGIEQSDMDEIYAGIEL
ncbi:tyrosine-type recombinase/integrase [Mechercharimyces sp. CAU 1602]|uniref:tyrosine-type recombinase/integrase n=1 Tax=Mechercharimyces sp. CAU 1602 TaxID=2973933 RepID=UPI0021638C96|nr:tyrosine-type recombinase/integrase [Mechercharimyces sp. CAU 1602]MCS1351693.1 tyrosine-type recombinase/integrase [Mechercharimyces sp. CAU 1602]